VDPHILCKHKLLSWMRLIAINRFTALCQIQLTIHQGCVFIFVIFLHFFLLLITKEDV